MSALPTPRTTLAASRHAKRIAFYGEIAAMRDLLAHRFPACFAPKGGTKRPLAHGTTQALFGRCPDLRRAVLRATIRQYVHTPSYLRAMVPGAPRVDLDGVARGTVSEEAAVTAARSLKTMRPERSGAAEAARCPPPPVTAPVERRTVLVWPPPAIRPPA